MQWQYEDCSDDEAAVSHSNEKGSISMIIKKGAGSILTLLNI